jgi:hypothetical protein
MISAAGPTLSFLLWHKTLDEEIATEKCALEAIIVFEWPVRLLEGYSQALEGPLQGRDVLCQLCQTTRPIQSVCKDGVEFE